MPSRRSCSLVDNAYKAPLSRIIARCGKEAVIKYARSWEPKLAELPVDCLNMSRRRYTDDVPLEDVKPFLSTRAYNVLRHDSTPGVVQDCGTVYRMNLHYLRNLPNCGKRTIREIIERFYVL